MIDIIFLAVIAGVLIIRLLMVLGEKRDDDVTPPFSLLDATKKKSKTVDGALVNNNGLNTGNKLPVAEVVEPEPVGFYLKGNNKEKDGKDEKKNSHTAIIEDSKDARWAGAWPGIMAVKAHDENFFAANFLVAAEEAFEIVLDCFVRGNETRDKKNKTKDKEAVSATELLKEYVAPELLTGFLAAISAREKNGYYQEHKNLIGVRQSSIVAAEVDEKNKICQVKVLFESDQIYALYDQDNKLIEGDDSTIIPKKDIWVFERKLTMGDSGRWWLVAVEE